MCSPRSVIQCEREANEFTPGVEWAPVSSRAVEHPYPVHGDALAVGDFAQQQLPQSSGWSCVDGPSGSWENSATSSNPSFATAVQANYMMPSANTSMKAGASEFVQGKWAHGASEMDAAVDADAAVEGHLANSKGLQGSSCDTGLVDHEVDEGYHGGWSDADNSKWSGWDAGGGKKSNREGSEKSPAWRIWDGETIYFGQVVDDGNAEQNHGLISSSKAEAQCRERVHVPKELLEDGNVRLHDEVAFFMAATKPPRVSGPLLKLAHGKYQEERYALRGSFKALGKGGGYLQSAEVKAFFGRDVWVNRDLAKRLKHGQDYVFNACLDAYGWPQATNRFRLLEKESQAKDSWW